jgi:hypothetical protein
MSLGANTDIFTPGEEALALARAAWGGRGFLTSVRRRQPDGTYVGAADAIPRDELSLVELPYTFDEPAADRRARLSAVQPTRGAGAPLLVVPVPVGEPQGLDTVAFFAECRLALPNAHLVVDLELLGHKLGQLCLSFGADSLMGSILDRRDLRLGARAGSRELTRDEAAQLLRAAGFAPCEQLPDGKVREL